MIVNGLSNNSAGIQLQKFNHIKEKEEPLHTDDKVSISSSPDKGEGFFNIALNINGTTVQKTIAGKDDGRELTINIKHTNDIHSNMQYVAPMIKPEEFWVDAGDAFQGYNFSSVISGGHKEVELMNLMGCDLATTGNHFYDDGGLKNAQMLMKESDFTYISANTSDMLPYAVANVDGVKIAFLGVRTPKKRFSMVDPSLVKDVKITDPVEALKKSVEEVKSKGIDNVVVLSHLGLEKTAEHSDIISDKDVARLVPGIDLIIGGHTHTPTKDKVEVNGTRIVHAGIDSHDDVKTDNIYVGNLSIKINKETGKISSIEDELIPVDRKKPLDGDIKAIQEKYTMEEQTVLSEKLGKADGTFTHEFKSPVDSSLGNLIADSMRSETGADVAVIDSNFFSNRGKNTGPITLPSGEITVKELTETAPWMGSSLDLRAEMWDVKGQDLKKLLEEGVSKLLGPKKDEGLYQVSGLKMSYNPDLPEGQRITEITVGDKPLDGDRNYKLATSYYVGNWNKIFSSRDENTVSDGRKIRLITGDYIKSHGTVCPETGNRIEISKSN